MKQIVSFVILLDGWICFHSAIAFVAISEIHKSFKDVNY